MLTNSSCAVVRLQTVLIFNFLDEIIQIFSFDQNRCIDEILLWSRGNKIENKWTLKKIFQTREFFLEPENIFLSLENSNLFYFFHHLLEAELLDHFMFLWAFYGIEFWIQETHVPGFLMYFYTIQQIRNTKEVST